jgi:hypothetical protein
MKHNRQGTREKFKWVTREDEAIRNREIPFSEGKKRRARREKIE